MKLKQRGIGWGAGDDEINAPEDLVRHRGGELGPPQVIRDNNLYVTAAADDIGEASSATAGAAPGSPIPSSLEYLNGFPKLNLERIS